MTLQVDVTDVRKAYEESRRARRSRAPRQSSGRRELLGQIAEEWPELGDAREWRKSDLLKPSNQAQLLADIQALPAWKTFEDRRQQSEAASKAADQAELRSVKYRRLLRALETVVLERNLPLVASPEIVDRYRQMVALEESSLQSGQAQQ